MASPTLVIVPTYNERENLLPLAQRLLALPVPVDLLVVDDNSPDGTGQLADELVAMHPQIHVLHRQTKDGLGRAYCAGFTWALAVAPLMPGTVSLTTKSTVGGSSIPTGSTS